MRQRQSDRDRHLNVRLQTLCREEGIYGGSFVFYERGLRTVCRLGLPAAVIQWFAGSLR